MRLIKQAAALREGGAKMVRVAKPAAAPLRLPSYFTSAVRKNRKALAAFEAFPTTGASTSNGLRRENGRDAAERLDTAVQWMAEGKPRNWKYLRPKA